MTKGLTPKQQAKKRGRPSLFKPEYVDQARKLCLLGATDPDLANFFGIALATIDVWKKAHADFLNAVKGGKAELDAQVERSLYHRAMGYEHQAVKIFMPAGAKKPVHAPYVERYPPDPTSMIFWLKNRQPQRWRDKQEIEHSGTVNLADRVQRAKQRTGS